MPRTRLAPSPAIEVLPDESNPFAAAPTRATGNLLLSFADRIIPCAVFAGTEDGGVKRGEYTEVDGEYVKVGRVNAVKNEDGSIQRIVPSAEVVKLVESDRGLIPLTDDEIAAAVGCEGGLAEVSTFLPLSVMTEGKYVIDSLYQLRPAPPARGGARTRRSDTTEKAFGLLIKAMRLEGVFALVQVALRGKPRYAAFLPDGRLYTLRYQNEVRLPLTMPDTGSLPDEDVMLARMMVVSKTSNIPPVLTDVASQKIRDYVEAKATETLPEPVPRPQPDRSYSDMIAALRASVTGMGLVREPVTARRRGTTIGDAINIAAAASVTTDRLRERLSTDDFIAMTAPSSHPTFRARFADVDSRQPLEFEYVVDPADPVTAVLSGDEPSTTTDFDF